MRTKLVTALVAVVLTSGCYDSRWGEEKKVQKMTAAKLAAPTLRADADDTSAAPTTKRARVMRVRARVTTAYGAHVVAPEKHIRELLDDSNRVLEPLLGIRLELAEIRSWDLSSDDDVEKALESLRAADPGDDVDWVAGFLGALPRTTASFHDLGYGALAGRHLVVRAPSSADEHDAIERSFNELSEEERSNLRRGLRRHRAATVFLHELGHTLGSVHETSAKSIMFHQYNPRVSVFGPDSSDVMRVAVARRIANENAALPHDVAEALKRAPPGAFVASERDALVARLESTTTATRPAPAPAAPLAPEVPEAPQLGAEDRERFTRAYEARGRGEYVKAWETAKPLFARYPDVVEVQDLRCQLATAVFPFDQARRECDTLMSLMKDPRRAR